MEAFSNFILRYRKAIVAFTILLSLGAAGLLTQLKVDTDFANYLPADDPVVVSLKEAAEAFGSRYTAIVLIEAEDAFAPENLRGVARLTEGFKQHDGVASVISLTDVVDIKKTEGGLEVADLIPDLAVLDDPAALAELKQYILGKSTYSNFLVSANGRYTAMYVNLAEDRPKDLVAKELRALTEELWPAASRAATIRFAGEPMLVDQLQHIVFRDMTVLVPLVLFLLVAILYLSFRNLRGVLLPMATVLMASAMAFGLMGLTGSPLTLIAAIMPVVLLSNGSAYGIHVLNFIQLSSQRAPDSATAVRDALRQVTLPTVLSAVTTVIAFLSFIFAVLTIFRSFGIYIGIGIAASLGLALTFIPAVVAGLKLPRSRGAQPGEHGALESMIEHTLCRVAHTIHDRRRTVLALTVLVTIGLVPGIFRLHSDFDLLGFFQEDSEPRQADAVMTREFGGTVAYMVHVKGPVKDPLVLGEIYRLQKRLRRDIGSSLVNSIADVIAEMNDSLNGQRAVPPTRAGIASLYLLMEGKDQLNQLVTPTADQALITARLPQLPSAATNRNVAAVNRLLAQTLRPELVDLPLDAVPETRRSELAALIVDELLDDLAVDLANAGRKLADPETLRPLLQAAVLRPGGAGGLDRDARQQVIAAYLTAEDCDLFIEDAVQGAQLGEALAALDAPDAAVLEQQIQQRAPNLAEDAEGVKLAAAAIVRRLGEEQTRRASTLLLDAVLQASAPAGEATASLRSTLNGELSRLGAGTWPVTPARYAELVGKPPAAEAIVRLSAAQTGQPLVFGSILERVVESQLKSLGLCLVLVLVVMIAQLRSLKSGVIAMVPILFTLVLNFGLMGYAGFTLNVATALIASLAIGIGIDYTVHTSYRIRFEVARGGEPREVLERVFISTGRAVLINATAVMAGFLVIMVSDLNILKHFGGLSALSIGVAALSALTIYPVLVLTLDRQYLAPAEEAPGALPTPELLVELPAEDDAPPVPLSKADRPGATSENQPTQGGTL